MNDEVLWVFPNDSEADSEDDDLRTAIEASKLTAPPAICSADGTNILCTNPAFTILSCGHEVCTNHLAEDCHRCDYITQVASRRIQRAIKKFLFRRKLRLTIEKRNKSATQIIGFFKIIKAKKIKRQLHHNRCRQRFLNRFTQPPGTKQ